MPELAGAVGFSRVSDGRLTHASRPCASWNTCSWSFGSVTWAQPAGPCLPCHILKGPSCSSPFLTQDPFQGPTVNPGTALAVLGRPRL